MPDVKFNEDGDLASYTEHTDGLQEVIQKIYIRLKTHQGEWMLDDSKGVPYLSWLQSRDLPMEDVSNVIISEIESVEDVIKVEEIQVSKDGEGVDITADVITEFGEYTLSEVILIGQ
jgi:hypothetical protein